MPDHQDSDHCSSDGEGRGQTHRREWRERTRTDDPELGARAVHVHANANAGDSRSMQSTRTGHRAHASAPRPYYRPLASSERSRAPQQEVCLEEGEVMLEGRARWDPHPQEGERIKTNNISFQSHDSAARQHEQQHRVARRGAPPATSAQHVGSQYGTKRVYATSLRFKI